MGNEMGSIINGIYYMYWPLKEFSMAEIWRPQEIDIYKYWIDMIKSEASDKLNSWEIDFINSLDSRLERNINLTENQANKLESIYVKYTS